jgi:hypothetical protein
MEFYMTGARKQVDEEKLLRGAGSWQYQPKPAERRLGEEIVSYLERHSRTFEKNASLLEIWEQALPPVLRGQCRPGKRTGNTLYVEVTPGVFMHEMQTRSGEVLEKLQQLSPRCGIRKIQIVPKIF